MKIKSLALTLALGLVMSFDGFAQAAPLDGCASLGGNLQVGSGHFISDFQFYAGETFVTSAGPPSIGSPAQIDMIFDFTGAHTVVDSSTIPGTVSHLFLADEVVTGLGFDISPAGSQVTLSFSCAELEPATPVPTLNWQGIAVLVTLLMGFAYYRRRKIF